MGDKKIEVLKILASYLEKYNLDTIGFPALDRTVMDYDKKIILDGEIHGILNELSKEELITFNGKGFAITTKGKNYIQ